VRRAAIVFAILFLAALLAHATEEQVSLVVEEYVDSWLFKDYEEMYLVLAKEETDKLSESDFAEKLAKATFVPITAEIASVRLKEDTAKARITLKDAHELVRKETLRLRKEDGQWKVVPLYLEVPAIARSISAPAPEQPPPAAQPPLSIPQRSVEEILNRLTERGEEVTDLIARIKYESPVMGMSVAMSGDMMYKRPNKFRLDFITPAEMSIISNGRTLWIAALAAKVAYAADVRDLQEQETVILGLGDSAKKMAEDYDITYMGTELVGEKPSYRLKLKSKKEDAPMVGAELWIDSDLWIPIKTVGEASNGLKVAFSLQTDSILINAGVEDELFEYKMPEGMSTLPFDMSLFGQ